MPATRPLAERFWEKVNKNGPVHPTLGTLCWEWLAGRNAKGYGLIMTRSPRRPMLAHRVSWWLHTGLLAAEVDVLHRCDNTGCVRPDHLFLGTQADNTADMIRKGRARFAAHALGKSCCPKGHAYDEENTYRKAHGHRACRECRRIRDAAKLVANRAKRREENRRYREMRKAADPEAYRAYRKEQVNRRKAADRDGFLAKQRRYSRRSYWRKKGKAAE